MRLNYTDDEDFPGQFGLWQGNCSRSIRSKAGQAALKRLEAALLAMPDKRLIREKLQDYDGNVCALGALARQEGVLPEVHSDHNDSDPDEFGRTVLKFPRLVAWKVVEQNDIQNEEEHGWAEGPNPPPDRGWPYRAGIWTRREITPEERYRNVLSWVQACLDPSEAKRAVTPAASAAQKSST